MDNEGLFFSTNKLGFACLQKDDLEILCQRHTTSKLVDFEDLQRIETLGFRGEALASMSYVSHLSVITKRRTDPHAWQAVYENGNILDGHPRPSAGVNGTTVAIDDLFFSVPMRKKVRCSPDMTLSKNAQRRKAKYNRKNIID
jgi:DNA mismatch repair protein MLH1